MNDNLIIVRGGGDIATGSIQKLYRAGFDVLVLEIEKPTCIRRQVSIAQAIYDNEVKIEDMIAVRCETSKEISAAFGENKIAVVVDPDCKFINKLKPLAVVDAILAKKNLGTNRAMAPITIGLGPGFVAGDDVDLVIETNRGHNLGRIIFEGPAAKNTGNPGNIDGYTTERILRSPSDGQIHVIRDIGSIVAEGETVATVAGIPIKSQLKGIVRGMITEDVHVTSGLKVGDVDPRIVIENVHTLSDKTRCVGGGVLEAVLMLKKERNL